jgi:hypothetical protein
MTSGRIRTLLLIALGITGLALVSAERWVPLRNQRTCVNQMNQWYSAAVQSCLEKNVKADRLFTIEELSPLVGGTAATCPSTKRPYPPFTIAKGPTCASQHDFAGGQPRPLRAVAGTPLAGVYQNFGWTNLIDSSLH